jgi:hypothetical protein
MAAEDTEPEQCMPCRGTGRVISSAGGVRNVVECPWCRGGGVRLKGIDAQVRWLDGDAGASERSGSGPGGGGGPRSEPPDDAA